MMLYSIGWVLSSLLVSGYNTARGGEGEKVTCIYCVVSTKTNSIFMKKIDPCKKYACKLQTCLQENVYQPARCEAVIEQFRQCCIKHSSISLVCEGIDTTKPYKHNTVDYLTAQQK